MPQALGSGSLPRLAAARKRATPHDSKARESDRAGHACSPRGRAAAAERSCVVGITETANVVLLRRASGYYSHIAHGAAKSHLRAGITKRPLRPRSGFSGRDGRLAYRSVDCVARSRRRSARQPGRSASLAVSLHQRSAQSGGTGFACCALVVAQRGRSTHDRILAPVGTQTLAVMPDDAARVGAAAIAVTMNVELHDEGIGLSSAAVLDNVHHHPTAAVGTLEVETQRIRQPLVRRAVEEADHDVTLRGLRSRVFRLSEPHTLQGGVCVSG